MNQELLLRHAAAPGRPLSPSAPRGLMAVMMLGIRELVLSKKTLLIVVLGALLAGASIAHRLLVVFGLSRTVNVPLFFGMLVTEAFLRFLLPMVSLFYGASLVSEEVDGRTLTYLTTRPIDKRVILWGKFLAFEIVASTLLLTSLFLSWLPVATAVGPSGMVTYFHLLAKNAVVVMLGLLAYGAAFTLLGALLRKPVIPGLIFIYVWEFFVSFLPGTAQRLTILHYLQSLSPHVMSPIEELSFLSSIIHKEHPVVAVLVLLVLASGFLFAAGVTFREREYRLEK